MALWFSPFLNVEVYDSYPVPEYCMLGDGGTNLSLKFTAVKIEE